MEDIKRLLIITYYWPPTGGSGVQRWVKFSKYLPEYGWQPVIYTPENPERLAYDDSLLRDIPPEAEIIRRHISEPYNFYRKLFGKGKQQTKVFVIEHLSPWVAKISYPCNACATFQLPSYEMH